MDSAMFYVYYRKMFVKRNQNKWKASLHIVYISHSLHHSRLWVNSCVSMFRMHMDRISCIGISNAVMVYKRNCKRITDHVCLGQLELLLVWGDSKIVHSKLVTDVVLLLRDSPKLLQCSLLLLLLYLKYSYLAPYLPYGHDIFEEVAASIDLFVIQESTQGCPVFHSMYIQFSTWCQCCITKLSLLINGRSLLAA